MKLKNELYQLYDELSLICNLPNDFHYYINNLNHLTFDTLSYNNMANISVKNLLQVAKPKIKHIVTNHNRYLFTSLLFFLLNVSLWATPKQDKINQIEELLFFYPQKGESELNTFIQNHKPFTINDENKINYLQGILGYKKSDTDAAITYLQNALFYFTEENNSLYIAKTQLILGAIAEKVGNLDEALLFYYQVIEVAKKNKELGYAYLGVARCQRYLHGIKTDKNYELETGIKLLKSIGKKEYDLYATYVSYALTTKGKEQKQKLKNIAKEYIKIGIKESASSVYKTLSYIYLQENELDSSNYYIKKAIPLTKTIYPTRSIAPSLFHIKGLINFRRKNYIGAEKNYKYALNLSDSLNQNAIKPFIYKSMAKLDSVNGNYESAKSNRELSKAYFEIKSQAKNNNQIKAKELSLKVEFQQNHLKKIKWQVTALALLIIAITIALLSIILIIRKKNRYEREQAQRRMNGMQNLLVGLGQSFEADKLEKEEIKEMFSYIEEEEGPTPYDCFEEAYADAIVAFKKKFPQLAEGEIRYAIMIYIGLSMNIIAYIKNVHVDTVRKTKRRMREKLDLKKGTDLRKHFYRKIDIEVNKRAVIEIFKLNDKDSADNEQLTVINEESKVSCNQPLTSNNL